MCKLGFQEIKITLLIRKKSRYGRLDLIGKDLRRINLKGLDLAGALLVAADFRGKRLDGYKPYWS
ncbi:MAG: pentapeptide repeat-containing protein [Bacillaceae bacterium]|nr:pentapeptide repeat-containing protein [Bacillaceae bacterium]